VSDFSLADYALVFVGAMAVTLGLTPIAIRVATRFGVVDRPAAHKFHRTPTPYWGGLAILLAVGLILGVLLVPRSVRIQVIVILGAAVFMGLVGALDDWLTLPVKPRVAAQWVAASAVWLVHVRVSSFHWAPADYVATVLVVLAVTNAWNLLDNMNGLLAGTAAIAAAFFFVVAYREGQVLVALMSIVLAGSCLGFLPYNLWRARIFLGDAGALFIGFLLATLALKINIPGHPLLTRAAVPWLILAVPLFDTLLVMVSRARAARPVFRGGTDHSSHRLVALGATPQQAAMITYLAAIFSGGAALLVLVVDALPVTITVVTLATLGAIALALVLDRVDLGTTGTVEDAGAEARSGPT
jgi:UDP-GlcNAc:undecaprenyl-phosphate GlcNAc-1-phosphate transferase